MDPLLSKGMNLAFILAVLAMVGGLALSWKSNKKETTREQTSSDNKSNPSSSKENAAGGSGNAGISMTVSGQGSISIGGDVISTEGNVKKSNAK